MYVTVVQTVVCYNTVSEYSSAVYYTQCNLFNKKERDGEQYVVSCYHEQSSRISAARYSSTLVRYTKKRKKEMGNNTLFLVIMSSITGKLENLF
jgi:hypothetical protein